MTINATTAEPAGASERITLIDWEKDSSFSVTHTNVACLPRPSTDHQRCEMDAYLGSFTSSKVTSHFQKRPNKPDVTHLREHAKEADAEKWYLADTHFSAGIRIADRWWKGLQDVGKPGHDTSGRHYKVNDKIITLQTHCVGGAMTYLLLQDHIAGVEVRIGDSGMLDQVRDKVPCENAED